MQDLTLGVLGGMGPEATVEFMRRVIALTPAADDADHLRMIVDNNPKVPSRIKAIIEGTGADPGPVLASMALGLEAAGADVLIIPCNTAHYYLPVIRNAVQIDVLDVVELTAARLQTLVGRSRKVGMLASPAVQQVGLFDAKLKEYSLSALYPDSAEQARLLTVIRRVKAGQVTAGDIQIYQEVAERLVLAGADALLVACTELSILPIPDTQVPAVDTLQILVAESVARCKRSFK